LFEVKLGDSPLEARYQIRLQNYASQVVLEHPFAIFTERPVTPSLADYSARWGISVQPPPKR
jgi:hypothetical protein